MTVTSARLADPHLENLRLSARSHAIRVETLCVRLDDRELCWQPGPGRWGIAQCLDHLVRTARVYQPRIQAAIEACRAHGWQRRDDYRPTWFGRRFLAAAGPNGRRKIRAARVFRPASAPRADAWREYLELDAALVRLLEEADGLDLGRAKVHSPLSRYLTLRLGEALTMLVVHDERHLMQAERVRSERAFPRAG